MVIVFAIKYRNNYVYMNYTEFSTGHASDQPSKQTRSVQYTHTCCFKCSYASYILVMIRIIKLERSLIKIFSFMSDSPFDNKCASSNSSEISHTNLICVNISNDKTAFAALAAQWPNS